MDRPGVVPVYIGDDVTDEDAFRALDGGVTICAGAARPTAARFALDGPEAVAEFLDAVDLARDQL